MAVFRNIFLEKARKFFFYPIYQIFFFELHFNEQFFSKAPKFSYTAPKNSRPKTCNSIPLLRGQNPYNSYPLGKWTGGRKVFKITLVIHKIRPVEKWAKKFFFDIKKNRSYWELHFE